MQTVPSQWTTCKKNNLNINKLKMNATTIHMRSGFFPFQMVVKITTQTQRDTSWFGLAKYAWSGSVIECPTCGEIHRSRQYWYGNKNPEDSAVR